MRKILTHIIILTLTVLPVHVISASAKSSAMKVNSSEMVQLEHECKHFSDKNNQDSTDKASNSCCDDVSHQCDNCNNCSQATGSITTLSSFNAIDKLFTFNTEKFVISNLLLNGVPKKNLLRPPRILV
jgi:hypothetical protein